MMTMKACGLSALGTYVRAGHRIWGLPAHFLPVFVSMCALNCALYPPASCAGLLGGVVLTSFLAANAGIGRSGLLSFGCCSLLI